MSVTTRPMDGRTNKPKLRLGNQKLAFFLSTKLIKYCELRVQRVSVWWAGFGIREKSKFYDCSRKERSKYFIQNGGRKDKHHK